MAKKQTNATKTFEAPHPLVASFSGEVLAEESRFHELLANVEHLVADEDFQKQIKEAPESASSDDDNYWPEEGSWLSRYRPYEVRGSTLHLRVSGTLVSKGSYQYGSYVTGYEYLSRAIARARSDDQVSKVALIVDSPGGHVAGMFDVAQELRELADEKEVRAFVYDVSASAAYALTSAASHVVASNSSIVGSIGILATHFSYEGAMKKAGIKVTQIYGGKHKADGSPYSDLTEQARARKENRVNKLYGQFVQLVADNRDEMDEKAVRGTEALTYDSEEALEIGLVDEVGNTKELLAEFAAETANERVFPMSRNNQNAAPEQAAAPAITQADLDKARQEGATAERERIAAIVALPEAEGRTEMAMKLATTPGIDADAAKGILETAPKAAAAEPKNETASGSDPENKEFQNHFEAQMDKTNEPVAGNPAPKSEEAEGTPDKVASLWADMGHK